MDRFLFVLMLSCLSFLPLQAGVVNDSIPADIYVRVDVQPTFPGGVYEGVQKYISRNFVYPADAWQEGPLMRVPVRFVITDEGRVCGVKIIQPVPPSLSSAIEGVLKAMPRWYPAYLNRRKVSTMYACTLPLFNNDVWLPYHVMPLVGSTRKLANWNKRYSSGMSRSKLEKLERMFGHITEMVVTHPRSTVTMARVLSAEGKNADAVRLMERAIEQYSRLDLWQKENGGLPHDRERPGYNGKNDVWMALQMALTYDAAGMRDSARAAYTHVMALADRKIAERDVAVPYVGTERHYSLRYTIEPMVWRQQFHLFYDPDQKLTYDEVKGMRYALTYEEVTRQLDYLIAKGTVTNARVIGSQKRIKDMCDEARLGKYNPSDTLRLYGVKALAVALRDGGEALRGYLSGLAGSGSEALAGYARAMSDRLGKYGMHGDGGREVAVDALACYAPVKEENADSRDNKRKATRFYEARKALDDIFPLGWLNTDMSF